MKTVHFFIIQMATPISIQCISLCLYKKGHMTKAMICFKFKVIYYA